MQGGEERQNDYPLVVEGPQAQPFTSRYEINIHESQKHHELAHIHSL